MEKEYEITIKDEQGLTLFYDVLKKKDIEVNTDGKIILNTGLKVK